MITSKEIFEKAGLVLPRQGDFWPDYDKIVLQSRFKATDDESFNKEWLAKWWMYLYKPGTHYPEQKVYSSYYNSLFRYFRLVRPSGYSPKTNQSAIKLSCIKKYTLKEHLSEFNFWLPHVIPIDGIKYIDIFEETHSEYGKYNLKVEEPNAELHFTQYGNTRTLKTFRSIKSAISYVRRNHYYE